MLKTVGKTIKWLVFSLVLCVVALFLINQFDETLKPEVSVLLQSPPSRVLSAQNAYFALIGLSAPSGVSPADWGQKLSQTPALHNQSAVSTAKPICDLEAHHCLRLARQQAALLQKALLEHQTLHARYLSARQLPLFEEISGKSINDPLPNFSTMLRAQMLCHAQIALWIEDKKITEALTELQRDITFQRRSLAGSQTLIGKMVALAALQRDYVLLADLMREQPSLMAGQGVQVRALLQPLTENEQSLLPAVRHEFRMSVGLIQHFHFRDVQADLGRTPTWFDAVRAPVIEHFLLPNASINQLYQLEQADELLAHAASGDFQRIFDQSIAVTNQLAEQHWRDVYNPVGKWLIALSRGDYSRYLRRPLEMNAFVHLLTLQQDIIDQHISDKAIPAFLAAHSLRNPFDGQAVEWDAPRHELFIRIDATAIQYKRFGKGHQRISVPL
jgi:hypothetical protein